ncbi:Flavanone 3-dioxygenase [Handroanthus impetiginosus]|uniref:Flavanone 3-dioxygenase n=1 Tax=Handroanthus impetiginosus TaxID=429701 RepID=A0A2G9G3D8_9LAMI|nr:Flavanone 3-dioxygenase [Handroanthus impetiginosus]
MKVKVVRDSREIVTYFSYLVSARDYSPWPDKPEGWRAVTKAYSEQLMQLGCKLLERHTDLGTISLLLQDQVGGLQATRDGDKTWITVQPVDRAFVVNLGDHGHYLSNGRFKNADHQAAVNSNYSRLSIATFQNPAPGAILYPLKIREGENPVMDEPITFSEMYKRKMNKDLELAKLKDELEKATHKSCEGLEEILA